MSPLYNTQVPPPALFQSYPQNEFPLFNNELLTVGEFSQQVSLPAVPIGSADVRLRLTVTFDADPGVFEIDIMECDDDLRNGTNGYAQIPASGQINTLNAGAPAGVFTATVDLSPFQGQFVALFVKTWPNAGVHCTALAARR